MPLKIALRSQPKPWEAGTENDRAAFTQPQKTKKKTTEKLHLTFSGNFTGNKATQAFIHSAVSTTLSISLWTLMGLGLITWSLEALIASRSGIFFIVKEANIYNLVIAFGAFAALYHWARTAQEKADEQTIDVFKTIGQQGEFDVYSAFSKETKRVWISAYKRAKRLQRPAGCADVFMSLLHTGEVKYALNRLGATASDIEIFLTNYVRLAPLSENGGALEALPFMAFTESLRTNSSSITPLVMLCGLIAVLPEDDIIHTLFINLSVALDDLEVLTAWINHAAAKQKTPELASPFGQEWTEDHSIILACCLKIRALEIHYKCFYEYKAITVAYELGGSLKDALHILIKTASSLPYKRTKNTVITEYMVHKFYTDHYKY